MNAIASSDYQPKGVWESRDAHSTAKATDIILARPERMMDLPGVTGGGTLGQNSTEQGRPYLAASSGMDRAYKVGRLKSSGAGSESEGFIVPRKASNTTRWREGTLL